jgi:hypothetical protein
MKVIQDVYVGKKAKEKQEQILRNIRKHKPQSGVYCISLAKNGCDLLEIYHNNLLLQSFYKNSDKMIVGIAVGYEEAIEVVTEIVEEMYHKTGKFDIQTYISSGKNFESN